MNPIEMLQQQMGALALRLLDLEVTVGRIREGEDSPDNLRYFNLEPEQIQEIFHLVNDGHTVDRAMRFSKTMEEREAWRQKQLEIRKQHNMALERLLITVAGEEIRTQMHPARAPLISFFTNQLVVSLKAERMNLNIGQPGDGNG